MYSKQYSTLNNLKYSTVQYIVKYTLYCVVQYSSQCSTLHTISTHYSVVQYSTQYSTLHTISTHYSLVQYSSQCSTSTLYQLTIIQYSTVYSAVHYRLQRPIWCPCPAPPMVEKIAQLLSHNCKKIGIVLYIVLATMHGKLQSTKSLPRTLKEGNVVDMVLAKTYSTMSLPRTLHNMYCSLYSTYPSELYNEYRNEQLRANCSFYSIKYNEWYSGYRTD